MENTKDFEWIELPSKGQCYTVGSPLRDGKIAVEYLTAMDENYICSDKLRSENKICETLLRRKIVGDFNALSLCTGDKEAVVLWLLKTGYGNLYKPLFSDDIINLDEVKYKDFLLRGDEEGHFRYTFNNGDKVVFRFLPFTDEEKAINKANVDLDILKNEDSTIEETYMAFTKSVLDKMIVSVNGKSDAVYIKEWLERLSYSELRAFQRYIIYNSPGLAFDYGQRIVFDDSVFHDIR